MISNIWSFFSKVELLSRKQGRNYSIILLFLNIVLRTEEGCTAAHYAAKSGQVEALRLLLDAGCPVTKAKLSKELRWFTVDTGSTLLEYAAESCDRRKGSLVLNRIMAARYKERRSKVLADTHLGSIIHLRR